MVLDAFHIYVLFLVLVALAFDFINGFHDAANSIATIVSTRVLTPRVAVIWAACFNVLAAFATGTLVASTIGRGIVSPDIIDPNLIFAALIGAIVWNLITWYWGLPSSSSHALIGGLAGAGLVKAGIEGLILWETTSNPLIYRGIFGIALYIVVAPLLGFVLGLISMTIVAWLCRGRRPAKVDGLFRKLQLLSSAVYSYSHGSNDAQKTMGIIYALLIAAGLGHYAHAGDIAELTGELVRPEGDQVTWVMQTAEHGDVTIRNTAGLKALPRGEVTIYGQWEEIDGVREFEQKEHISAWIILAAYLSIGLGTYFGGWRIVKTMGSKITKLQPSGGFCAETAGGVTILAMSAAGIPVSTTHTITGAIVGIGATRRLSAVRWGVARTVVWAWVFTIPAAAAVAALAYLPFWLFGG